jgi:hypothetical protein
MAPKKQDAQTPTNEAQRSARRSSTRALPVRFVVRGSVVETPEGFKLRF